jgi:hypothetical protein
VREGGLNRREWEGEEDDEEEEDRVRRMLARIESLLILASMLVSPLLSILLLAERSMARY